MSYDFERLVGSSNPAYKAQAQGGYPPRPPRQSLDNSNPFLIDDGEDYDDTPTTDSRLRQPPVGMASGSQSTYPYTYGQQPPTGYGAPGAQRDLLSDEPLDSSQMLARAGSTGSKRSNNVHGTGQPQGWTFDQDDPYTGSVTVPGAGAGGVLPFAGSKTFNGLGSQSHSTDELRAAGAPKKGGSGLGEIWKQLGHGKFPWQKEKVLTGERIIFLNDSRGNGEQGFISNYVSTTKYNLVTFLPKFLVGECTQLRLRGGTSGRS